MPSLGFIPGNFVRRVCVAFGRFCFCRADDLNSFLLAVGTLIIFYFCLKICMILDCRIFCSPILGQNPLNP